MINIIGLSDRYNNRARLRYNRLVANIGAIVRSLVPCSVFKVSQCRNAVDSRESTLLFRSTVSPSRTVIDRSSDVYRESFRTFPPTLACSVTRESSVRFNVRDARTCAIYTGVYGLGGSISAILLNSALSRGKTESQPVRDSAINVSFKGNYELDVYAQLRAKLGDQVATRPIAR